MSSKCLSSRNPISEQHLKALKRLKAVMISAMP